MAIDHVRDALHKGHPTPTDLSVTTPILFFTRFITHFCAPAFVFLSGISAYLAGTRRTRAQQTLFLVKRGLWLIVVELLVISFAITLNPHYSYIILQVIWAIGGSMVLLGLLIRLKATPAVIGIIIFASHNIFDIINPGEIAKTTYWQLLISGNGWDGVIHLGGDHVIDCIRQRSFFLLRMSLVPDPGHYDQHLFCNGIYHPPDRYTREPFSFCTAGLWNKPGRRLYRMAWGDSYIISAMQMVQHL